MSKQCPTEMTEITERLRIIGAKISVLFAMFVIFDVFVMKFATVLSVGLKTLYLLV